MLARFFKPKWQHPKPEKRAKAVSKLRASDAKAQAILSQLALEDVEDQVRLAATEKLTNLDLLIKISKKDPAESIRLLALHNISQILLSNPPPSLEEKLTALKSISESDLLTHLALNSSDKELREQAISQLNDNLSLLTIAEKSQRASVRVLAAERMTCPDVLEQLQKSSRNKDKGVFKVTRDKLQQFKEQEKEQALIQNQIEQLLASIAQHSTTDFFPLYSAKLSALVNDWEKLKPNANNDQKLLFSEHHIKCEAIVKAQEAKLAAAEEKAAQQAASIAEKDQAIASLSELQSSISELNPDAESLQQLKSQVNKLSEQWSILQQHAEKTERNNFDRIKSQISNIVNCCELYLNSTDQIQKKSTQLKTLLADQKDVANAHRSGKQLLNKISWPKLLTKPEELCRFEELLAQAEETLSRQNHQSQQLQSELNSLLDTLKTSIQQGEIKSADKQIKKAEQLSKRLNGELPADLEQRIKSLSSELQEIRDWQSYAVTPKKEALCVTMESLIESDLPIQERANQIRKVQKEWKELDATDSNHSQKLWNRFKTASDQAYAPCDQHFSEQKALRKNNLKQREQLCQELSQRCQQTSDEISDWKSYTEELHHFKQQWRSYSPVDRAPGKKLQVTFDKLIAQLEVPLKDHRDENARIKQQLVEKSQSLLNAEDMYQATEQIKELQKEWKAIGQAPRNQERKLWGQFRDNCNQVFETYFANRSSNTDSLQALSSICDELEQKLESATRIGAIEKRLDQAHQLLDQQSSTNQSQELEQRLEKISTFIQQQKHELLKFESEPYTSVVRKASLCEQLEHALLSAENSEAVTAICDAWNSEASTKSALDNEIASRFQTLLRLTEKPDEIENIIHEQEQLLRQLCIRLEIASSVPSPPEDQAIRMEYQMERLQQALDRQEQAFDLGEIKNLEYEWMCVPFADQYEELHDRFEQQLKQIF